MEVKKAQPNYDIKKLTILVKKLVKTLYINEFMKDKDIEAKEKELQTIKIEKEYLIKGVIENDIIRKIVISDKEKIIKEIKAEIQSLNKQYNLRLDDIIKDGEIDETKIADSLRLIGLIDDFYQYEKNKKEKKHRQDEIKELKQLIKEEKYLNSKIEPLIEGIRQEIEYISSTKRSIKSILIIKKHHQILVKKLRETINYLLEIQKSTEHLFIRHNYFFYETSVDDLIDDIYTFMKEKDYNHVYNILKNILTSNKNSIVNAEKIKNKKIAEDEQLNDESNIYFDGIIENLKVKKDIHIYHIVNSLYKFEENEPKQKLFVELLQILNLIKSIETNTNIEEIINEQNLNDFEVVFLKSIFSDNLSEKEIESHIELYTKIIELYKKDDNIIEVKKK